MTQLVTRSLKEKQLFAEGPVFFAILPSSTDAINDMSIDVTDKNSGLQSYDYRPVLVVLCLFLLLLHSSA
jgi:hypothetical protein